MEMSLEEAFHSFTSCLNLTEDVKIQAKELLQEISAFMSVSEVKLKNWIACSVYVASRNIRPCGSGDSENITGSHGTVSQLLVQAEVNIMDFFDAMCWLKKNNMLTDSSKQSLISLERKYCIVSAIYDKFENMISDLVNVDPNLQDNNDHQGLVESFKAFSWYLFLVTKAKVFWHGQDLLATFHLLLCCVAEVMKYTPTYILLPPFDNVVATTNDPLAVLHLLSDAMNTAYEEVKVVHECWLHVAGELMPVSVLPELSEIKSKYDYLYLQSCDIDEGLFLVHDRHLFPPSDSCSQTASPRKNGTPTVRRTLDTSQALYSIVRNTPKEFSPALKDIFSHCTKDPTPLIQKLVQTCSQKFVALFSEAYEKRNTSVGEKRFNLVVKYYYLMLDAVVKMESERLSTDELSTFFQNESFHRALLACCSEVVIMSCGSVGSINFTPVQTGGQIRSQGIVFPWVLTVFDLKAYHFFKVIECFIKTAPTITKEIIKHLKSLEDKILLSLAWNADSPVFEQFDSSLASSDNINERFWSPNKETSPPSHSQSSPTLSPAVNMFLNKVSRLAGSRLKDLCSYLKIKDAMLDNIWGCLEYILYKKNYLLKDRHLDQIIMCCIYAVCKALGNELRFKDIILCYTQLPHASETVYRQVLTDGKYEYIIAFYNKKFISEIQGHINSQFPSKTVDLSNARQSPLSPSYSIPGRRNIFISPLYKSPFKDPNEVMCQRNVHSFRLGTLNQSSRKLQAINEALRDSQTVTQNKPLKPKAETKEKKHCIEDVYASIGNQNISSSLLGAKKHLKFE